MRYSLRNLFFASISGFLLTVKMHSTYKELLSDSHLLCMLTQESVFEAVSIFAG
jgi:hypothetical protein